MLGLKDNALGWLLWIGQLMFLSVVGWFAVQTGKAFQPSCSLPFGPRFA